MPTRLFSDFTSLLAPSVPGCPTPVVTNYVRRAAREVCERTLAWRYTAASQVLTAGDLDYAYQPDTDTEVHAILSAKVNDNPISVVPYSVIGGLYPLWPDTDADRRGQPLYITQFSPTTYHVAPCPNAAETYTLNMTVALKPTLDATGMDEEIADELESAIQHGALQHLLVLPEKPWSDRELAAYHAKQYIFTISERRARTNVGAGGGALTARGSSFS
jgi:hypothetical protein